MSPEGEPPSAVMIDGRAMAESMLAEVRDELATVAAAGLVPGIRILRVGQDEASAVYAKQILRTAERVGAPGEEIELSADTDAAGVRRRLRALSDDADVAGIILQLPLPSPLTSAQVIDGLDPAKDIDGVHPVNAGMVARGAGGFAPSCPEAAIVMLKRSGTELAGREAVVIGRSNVVGKPAQLLLLREDATVTVCHRRTRDLAAAVSRAEVLVIAAGAPGLVTGEMVRPGAVVIDCGINVLADGSLAGDADADSVGHVAAAMTPVPGGVGPVTNAVLLSHLARAARSQRAGNVSVPYSRA